MKFLKMASRWQNTVATEVTTQTYCFFWGTGQVFKNLQTGVASQNLAFTGKNTAKQMFSLDYKSKQIVFSLLPKSICLKPFFSLTLLHSAIKGSFLENLLLLVRDSLRTLCPNTCEAPRCPWSGACVLLVVFNRWLHLYSVTT